MDVQAHFANPGEMPGEAVEAYQAHERRARRLVGGGFLLLAVLFAVVALAGPDMEGGSWGRGKTNGPAWLGVPILLGLGVWVLGSRPKGPDSWIACGIRPTNKRKRSFEIWIFTDRNEVVRRPLADVTGVRQEEEGRLRVSFRAPVNGVKTHRSWPLDAPDVILDSLRERGVAVDSG